MESQINASSANINYVTPQVCKSLQISIDIMKTKLGHKLYIEFFVTILLQGVQ